MTSNSAHNPSTAFCGGCEILRKEIDELLDGCGHLLTGRCCRQSKNDGVQGPQKVFVNRTVVACATNDSTEFGSRRPR